MWILMKGGEGTERHTPHVVCKCTVIDKMLADLISCFLILFSPLSVISLRCLEVNKQ